MGDFACQVQAEERQSRDDGTFKPLRDQVEPVGNLMFGYTGVFKAVRSRFGRELAIDDRITHLRDVGGKVVDLQQRVFQGSTRALKVPEAISSVPPLSFWKRTATVLAALT